MSKDAETALVIVGLGVVAYLIYQAVKGGAAAVGAATSAAGSAVADAAGSITNYGRAVPGGTYNVTMADGTVQTVPYGQLPNAAGAGLQSDTPIADAFSSGFGF
jgi:hypothetical protein